MASAAHAQTPTASEESSTAPLEADAAEIPSEEPEAEADEARLEECFRSYESSQVMLRDGKILSAQQAALACSSHCPAEIESECKTLVSDTKRDIPTALPLASTERGNDAAGIQLFVDGEEQSDLLGQELPLNPGAHEIRFVRAEDGWEETVQVMMRRGEKRLQVRVVVPDVAPPQPAEPAAPEEPTKTSRRIHPLVITAFAVGGAGFATAAVGGIVGLSYRSKLNNCSPGCDEGDADKWVSSGRSWVTVGDVGLAVGAVGVLTGTALLLWGPRPETKAPTAWFHVTPTVGGGAALVGGTF